MKLLYFGSDFDKAMDTVVSLSDGVPPDLIGWEPPDIEAPIWELTFKDEISMYSDGRVILVVEGEEMEAEKIGDKVTRMKRGGKSSDKVLENK